MFIKNTSCCYSLHGLKKSVKICSICEQHFGEDKTYMPYMVQKNPCKSLLSEINIFYRRHKKTVPQLSNTVLNLISKQIFNYLFYEKVLLPDTPTIVFGLLYLSFLQNQISLK